MKYNRKKGICICLFLLMLLQICAPIYLFGFGKAQFVRAATETTAEDIKDFPESYQKGLKELKEKHPNWVFKKVDIDTEWDTIIKNESAVGVNTITSDVPNGGTSGTYSAPVSYLSTEEGAYNAYEDQYKVIDSTNRYTPNAEVIAYYMDPRNFLTEEQIFQFEALKYNSSQTEQGVKQILKDTFMKGNYTYQSNGKKITKSYPKTFCTAGKKYKVNPYFLAVRARQEVGAKISDSTSGKYSGYKGYYNFFNIGAADSGNGTAVVKGLRYAKTKGEFGRPWNSQYKAILGGAQYISEKYIGIGQNTFYFQKFSVVKKKYLYWHQYMSNIEGAKAEAKKMYQMYRTKDLLKEKIIFRIPVYKNMPADAAKLPKTEGSSNNYMKTITVTAEQKKISLVTSKNYEKNTFTLSVPYLIKKVKVSGTTANKKAKIIGCKSYSLTEGKTKKVILTVTAENKDIRKYTIKIKRLNQD